MAKFSDVAAGIRARTPAVLPLPGATVDGETGAWSGPTADLDLRALNEEEYGDVLSAALAYAKGKGLSAPEDGDALYERGKMIHTLALACLDRESSKDAPRPFFDGGAEQIRKSEIMTPEVIAYLYERQQLWQDEISPLKSDLKPEQFLAAAVETAKGNMAFFVNSRPGIRWSFTRTLASLYVASLANSSPSSSSSGSPEM